MFRFVGSRAADLKDLVPLDRASKPVRERGAAAFFFVVVAAAGFIVCSLLSSNSEAGFWRSGGAPGSAVLGTCLGLCLMRSPVRKLW